jgi:hypothetical protein
MQAPVRVVAPKHYLLGRLKGNANVLRKHAIAAVEIAALAGRPVLGPSRGVPDKHGLHCGARGGLESSCGTQLVSTWPEPRADACLFKVGLAAPQAVFHQILPQLHGHRAGGGGGR